MYQLSTNVISRHKSYDSIIVLFYSYRSSADVSETSVSLLAHNFFSHGMDRYIGTPVISTILRSRGISSLICELSGEISEVVFNDTLEASDQYEKLFLNHEGSIAKHVMFQLLLIADTRVLQSCVVLNSEVSRQRR